MLYFSAYLALPGFSEAIYILKVKPVPKLVPCHHICLMLEEQHMV